MAVARARDDFSAQVKQALQNRVASQCSNPSCRASTAGPQVDAAKALNIGVAAHITAASTDGPRYDAALTTEQRAAPTNGIWLCQNCAKLIDNDPERFSVQVLHAWKTEAEESALNEIGRPTAGVPQATNSRPVVVLEYDCNFEETPEKSFTLNNVSAAPAYEVQITTIEYDNDRVEFEMVATLGRHARTDVMPDLVNEGTFFRRRLRLLLDKIWQEQRWLPAQILPKDEVEKLFHNPIVLPVTVSYRGGDRNTHVDQFELVYVYFAARAFIRFARG